MILKTQGIVLHSIKQGETSLVVRIFTRECGIQAYLVQGVRKAKSRMPQNLFQPLTLLSMVVYHNEKGGLQRIKELSCSYPFSDIPFSITKTSVAIFLAELLDKCLKQPDINPEMFDFVNDSIEYLDEAPGSISDFHLLFMLGLSRYLGFLPSGNYDERHCYFNLQEGIFQNSMKGQMSLDREQSLLLAQLLHTPYPQMHTLSIPISMRRILLQKIIDYYRLHLEGLKELSSHKILEEVLF